MTEHFPDTLYLPERAARAINCLTGILDHDKECLPYCVVDLTSDRPVMQHSRFDWSDHTARMIDAIILARQLSGSTGGEHELSQLKALLRRGFGADGLHYTPDNPWTRRNANTHYQRSVLDALISWYLSEQAVEARERIIALLDALKLISVKRDGFWYFPSVEYYPEGWPKTDWDIFGSAADPANTNGRLLYRLCVVHEALGYPVAEELARNYAAHVMHHSSAYGEDGSFATGMEFREGHFHSRAITMLGVARYGVTFHDPEAIRWSTRVFERAQAYGTSFGWFPERVVESGAHGCETCAVVDMMETAIWLARGGETRYWETAERFLRNQLAQSQYLKELTPDSSAEVQNVDHGNAGHHVHVSDEWRTYTDVTRRTVGGFAGWSQPNDLISKVMHHWDLYACCCGQGVRGLFNAWNAAVEQSEGELRVHLLINFWSPRVTVRSWLPIEGRLEIETRCEGRVLLRVPSWVERDAVAVSTVFAWDGEYVSWVAAQSGQKVIVTFPVPETTTEEVGPGTRYSVRWRGNQVVEIDPPGTEMPLYRRDDVTTSSAAMVERAVHEVMFSL